MLGSWVRAPGGSLKATREIKQIPDNLTLSGISFFWQLAENRGQSITRSHVHQIYRELETSGKVITVDLVRKLYYGVDEDNKTLLQVFREHNEQSRKLIGKDFVSKTVQRYETTTRYLEEFIKKEYQLPDIALNNLEANFISKFDAFLKIEKVVRRTPLSPD